MSDAKRPVVKAVCYDPGKVYRIEADGRLIAMALAFANGTWRLFGLDDRQIGGHCFRTPQMVAVEAERLGMHRFQTTDLTSFHALRVERAVNERLGGDDQACSNDRNGKANGGRTS